jgi:hypothetical protein
MNYRFRIDEMYMFLLFKNDILTLYLKIIVNPHAII